MITPFIAAKKTAIKKHLAVEAARLQKPILNNYRIGHRFEKGYLLQINEFSFSSSLQKAK